MRDDSDGGSAFPVPNDANVNHQEDMALRDYFAAKALQGLCANPSVFARNGMSGWGLVNCTDKQLLQYTYMLADEALQARKA